MLYMIFVKSIITRNPICKFNINRRTACLHQFQIHKQPSRSPISINNFLYEPHAGLPQMRTIPKDCSRSKKSKIGATILIMTI